MLSDERSRINDEFEKEVKALEAKFMERKKPLLQKRNDIVLGKITDFAEYIPKYEKTQTENEEIVVGVVKSDKDKAEDEEEAKSHVPTDVTHLKGVAGIPDFWTTAIKNNQMMMQTIREKDADTLQYITNVEASETQEPRTITIKIYYKENEYFTNPHLELMARFKDDQQDEVVETQGTLIDWKDGKDLTKKKIKKKQKNKKTGETRTIIKTVPAESFYNAFESRKAPEGLDEDDEEDEETAKILDALDESMQIAMDFSDLYNWEALEYYLNFGQSLGDFAGMHGEDDDEDGEGSNSDDEKPAKKAVKPAAGGAAPQGGADGKQQECKQQ